MDSVWRAALWEQFAAAIDMLDNALVACPTDLWDDPAGQPRFWYLAYHTLFWLDLYLSDSLDGFAPPAPFTLDELKPEGVMPERVYTKSELRGYLEHCRRKCRERIEGMTEEQARQRSGFDWLDVPAAELILYNLRHVQHGVAQLNLLLRQATTSAPAWVARAGKWPGAA